MDEEAINLFGFTTWLSPSLPSVPNRPGLLLINHLWKKYITARCMFSPSAFSETLGSQGRLSGTSRFEGNRRLVFLEALYHLQLGRKDHAIGSGKTRKVPQAGEEASVSHSGGRLAAGPPGQGPVWWHDGVTGRRQTLKKNQFTF